MKNALILMTALVPTTGHADIISFASSLPNTRVHVLINGRTFEPVPSIYRKQALNEHFKNNNSVIILHRVRDDAPQNESDMNTPEEFWNWWKKEVNTVFPNMEWDYVVASENYGIKMAETLNADFIPYDIERGLNNVRGNEVRSDIWNNWKSIIPEFRQRLALNTVMFGQESVGKTTLSKMVSERLGVNWYPEYARPYLETVGNDVTLKSMSNIHSGQVALQKFVQDKANNPVNIFDTDLFSTVGYYGIMSEDVPNSCIVDALRFKSNVYYLLPDDVPFVPDVLRYGVDKRESDLNFWVNILEKFHLNYVNVPSGSVEYKADWIANDVRSRFLARVKDIQVFVRD